MATQENKPYFHRSTSDSEEKIQSSAIKEFTKRMPSGPNRRVGGGGKRGDEERCRGGEVNLTGGWGRNSKPL